jgi:hypothetical protein
LPVELRNVCGPTGSWVTGRSYDQSAIWLPSAFVGMTTRWGLLGGNFNALSGFIGSFRSMGSTGHGAGCCLGPTAFAAGRAYTQSIELLSPLAKSDHQ